MKSHPFIEVIFRRAKIFSGVILLVALAAVFASPLERRAWGSVREHVGELKTETLSQSAGTGIALGTLGGFRTVIADIAWLRAFHFWEKREPVSCLKYGELAMALSPDQMFFLENMANFVAFDFPVWEIRRRGGFFRLPVSVQKEIQKQAMNNALELLEEAEKNFPKSPKIFVLAAQIVMLKTELVYGRADFEKAASYYRRACELPDAPWYAFSSYAKFISEQVPEKRIEAEMFLRQRRITARTRSEIQLFDELLEEFFSEKKN